MAAARGNTIAYLHILIAQDGTRTLSVQSDESPSMNGWIIASETVGSASGRDFGEAIRNLWLKYPTYKGLDTQLANYR